MKKRIFTLSISFYTTHVKNLILILSFLSIAWVGQAQTPAFNNLVVNSSNTQAVVTFSAAVGGDAAVSENLVPADFTVTISASTNGGTVAAGSVTVTVTHTAPSATATLGFAIPNASTADGSEILTVKASGASVIFSVGGAMAGTETITANLNDLLAPTITSINRLTPGTNPTNSATLIFRVIYSESVTGVAAGNFTAALTDVTAGTITTVTGSGTTWDVTVPTVAITTLGTDGSVRLDADATPAVTDAAGNAFAGTKTGDQTYTIDQSPPPAPTVPNLDDASDSNINSDDVTNDNTPTFTVTGTNGMLLEILDGASVVASITADGTAQQLTTSALPDGTNKSITARTTDGVGNTTSSAALLVTIDTGIPSAPSIPDLTTDSGSSGSDNITNDNTPDFLVTGTLNHTLEILVGGSTVVATAASATGSPQTLTASTLSDAAYSVTARTTDLAGNSATSSALNPVTIDTTPPSAPTVPNLQAGSDLGASSTDDLTSDNTPTFSVTGTNTLTLDLLDGGSTVVSTITSDGTSQSLTASTLSDGLHNISARTTDVAGNTASSSALAVTIDTDPPAITSITPVLTMSRGIVFKTGTITTSNADTDVTGNGTSFLTQLFVGAVLLQTNGTVIGTVASISTNTDLVLTGNAANNLTNQPFANMFYFTATFDEPMNNSSLTTADFAEVGTGDTPPFSVVPSTGPNSSVFYVHVTSLLNDNGTTRIDLTNNGYQDAAGNNVTATSTGTSATIDNTAPVFSAQSPATNAFVNSARVGYTLTETNGPLVSGTVTWTRTSGTSDGGTPHVIPLTGTELNSGVRALAPLTNDTINLKNGTVYTVSFSGTDAAGNVSTAVTSTNVTNDEAVPADFTTGAVATTGGTVVAGYWNSTNNNLTVVVPIESADLSLTNGSVQIQWAKSSAPGVFTSITGSGISTITGPQVTAGTKTVTVSATDLETAGFLAAEGETITIRAIITDRAGNSKTGANSASTFVEDQTVAAPSVPDLDPLDDTGINTDNVTKNTTGLTFTGTAEPGATVQLRDNTTNIGSTAIADGGGVWSITVSLTEAVHPINARQTDVAGNPQSAASGNLSVTVDTTVPIISATAPAANAFVNHKRVSYTLSTAVASGTITWTQTGGTADPGSPRVQTLTGSELSSGAHTDITLTNNPALVDGAVYTVTFNASDLAANAAVTITTLGITYDVSPPTIIGATFFSSFNQDTDASFTTCNGTAPDHSSGSQREYVHLTLSEPLNLANGALPSIVTAGTSYGFNAAGYSGSWGGTSYGTIDITCDNRGGSAYHPTNVIHLQANFITGTTDGLWSNSTTFSFTTGGSNVKDLAGNEMASIATISTTATAPKLASSMVLDPNPSGPNTPESITFTVDQTLSTTTTANAVTGITVDADGAGPGTAVTRPGTYNTSGNTVTVTSTADGQWTSATTVTYTSGTGTPLTTTVPMASFGPERILLGPVTISSNNANTTLAKETNTISVTFTVNPGSLPLSGTPFSEATIGGIDVLSSQTGSNPYTFSLVTSGATAVPETSVAFSITADQLGRATTVTKTIPGSTVTYDKTRPANPPAPVLAAADDSGISSSDAITKNNTDLTFSGTVDNSSTVSLGATVNLYNGVTLIGTTTANGSTGAWSIDAYPSPATLSDGTYSITIQIIDAAGNAAVSPSPALTLTIDNAISPPTGFNLATGDDSGVSNSDRITKNTSALTITGTSDNFSRIQIWEGAMQLVTSPVTITANGSGNWTADISLTEGVHAITALQIDLAGNVSALNGTPLSITIDTTPPSASGIPDLNSADDTGVSNSDNLTKNTTGLTWSSASIEPNAYVQIFDGVTGLGTVYSFQADNAGDWTGDISLTEATHSITTIVTDAAGNSSGASPNRNITIDATPPTISPRSITSNGTNSAYAKIGDVVSVSFSSNESIAASGPTAPAGSIDGVAMGFTLGPIPILPPFTTGTGSITTTAGNTEGILAYTFTINDFAGNATTHTTVTNGSTVTFDKTPPSVQSIVIDPTTVLTGIGASNGTISSSIKFIVTFNENVTNISFNDFDPSYGPYGGNPSYPLVEVDNISVPPSSTANQVIVTGSSINGTGKVKLDFFDSNTIRDLAGNTLGGPGNQDFSTSFTTNQYYTVVLQEPSLDVGVLNLNFTTTTSISVFWSGGSAPVNATHFLVLARPTVSGSFPSVSDSTYVNSAALVQNIARTGSGSHVANFSGLNSGMSYSFTIYPYTLSPNTTRDNINFKTGAPPALNNISTGIGSQTTISPISAAGTIGSDKDTPGEIVDVFTFRIKDDGPTPATEATDNAPFKFTGLTITPGSGNDISDWTQAIQYAELVTPTGGTRTGTVQFGVFAPGTSSIIFSAGTSDDPTDFGFISDNGFKDYTLRIYLKSDMDGTLNLPLNIDGLNFAFNVSATNVPRENTTNNQTSSNFIAGTAAESGSTNIAVDVYATKLVFNTPGTPGTASNPQGSIGVGTPFSQPSNPEPVVYALDVNNNLDKNYNASINTSSALGFFNGHTNFSSGVLTLSNFYFTTQGSGTITISGNSVSTPIVYPALTGLGKEAVSSSVNAVITDKTTISDALAPGSERASFASTTNSLPTFFNFDFTVTDDDGADATDFTDNDALPTLIQTVTITQSSDNGTNLGGDVTTFDNWTLSIAGAELTDGTSTVTILNPSANITGSSLIFNVAGTTMETVANNLTKTYQLRIWLLNPVAASLRDIIDNKDFAFAINQSNLALSPTPNTTSAMANSGTSTGDNRNVVTVTATQLDFVTQPPTTQNYDINLTTTPVVKARDANQNLDLNYTSNATLVASELLAPSFPLSTTAFTFVGGVVNLTPVAVSSAGGGLNNQVIKLQLNDTPDVGTVSSALSNDIQLTYSGESDIVKDVNFVTSGTLGNSYIPNIESINNIDSVNLTAANSIALERFLMRDGGSDLTDTDGTNTKLASITFNIENYQNIKRIGIYDGNTEIQELPNTSFSGTGDITFSGISTFEATDNTEKALTVRVSFKTKVTDNQALRVRVISATAGGVSSQISAASTAFVTLTGNDNKIEVIATKITFDNAPASASANVSMNPPADPLRVTARDFYNNQDFDYNGAVSFSGTPPALGNTQNYDVANLPVGNFSGGVLFYPIDNISTPLVDEGYQFTSGTTFTQLTINGAVANTAGSVHNASPITGISPAPGVEIKTSFESWLYFDPSFAYTTRIPFVTMQETSLTTTTNSVELGRLVLSDGGSPGSPVNPGGIRNLPFGSHNDIDAAFTKIQGFTVSITNFADVRRIGLFDAGGTLVPGTEQDVTSGTVVFTGLSGVSSLWAADNDVSKFYVRASFKSAVTDLHLIQLQITNVVWSSGSRFPLTDGTTTVGGVDGAGSGGDSSDGTKNIINVVATKFDFTGSQHGYAGINQPVPLPPAGAYEVRAHDQFNNLDTEFNFASNNTLYAVTVTAPSGPLTGSFTFSNGIMVMSDLKYTTVGNGKLTVTSTANTAVNSNVNNPGATPPNVADPCDPIHVVHTQANINTNGPTTANNLKGGTNNVVIFGVTFTVSNPDNTNNQPKLQQFTFSFDKAFRTGPTTATLKNFRVFESLTGAYISGTTPNVTLNNATVSEGKSTALVNAAHRDLVTVTFANGFYRNIAGSSFTFYLMCDIDATASNATPSLRPQLLSGGHGTPDYANIQVTEGSVFANVLGTEFGFASVKPPKLVSSIPANGQLNVNPNQSTVQLTFDVPVWTLDGKAYLYDSVGNKIADLNAINGRHIPPTYNEPVTGGLNSPSPPLTFTIPVALGANEVYYILLDKGVNDIQNPSNNRGIMDDQSNLFGGITYSGGLRFKTANPAAPKLKDTDSNKYFISASGGVINGLFDQRGKAYFLVTDAADPAPTKAQITGGLGYGGTVYGRDTIDVKLINTLQYGSFTAVTPLAASPTQYAVWMYAENDALPTPIATGYPYLSVASDFAQNTGSIAEPTFTFSYTPTSGLYLNKPGFQICSESFVTLADPIIIEEGATNDFTYDATGPLSDVQSFNLLLPQGFEFDRNTLPTVELVGEFTGKATPVFTNNTILKVSFINTGNVKIDKIVITGIRLRGESGLATASIQRLGGNAIPGLADETDLATISVLDADPGTFTNSYTLLNQASFASIGINNVVSVIPDNFSDPGLSSPNSTKLLSMITGDYGPVEFTGPGVSNEVLSLSGVTLNTSFSIVMKHTDMNGCVSNVSQQYQVYDHNTAIPGLPTKQPIVNTSFPTLSPSFYPADSVTYATFSGYSLDTLIAKVPDRILPGQQIIDRSSAWLNLIRQIPQWNPISPVDFNDYGFDYKFILNDSILAGAGVLPKQAYNNFRETTQGGRYYWRGGSMGLIEYTGRYRNSADTTVLIPIRQEVEIFVPPIPVIEISQTEISGYDPADPLHLANVGQPQLWPLGAPIFCENGNDILITGYPRAVQGLSTGSFSLVDAATSNPIPLAGFIDNGNGTATLKPGLLKNGYNDIKIRYRFKEINSPIDSVGTLIIRISPNPIASFTATSVMTSRQPIQLGRPSVDNAYCEDNLIRFDNTSDANFPVPGYVANTNPVWTLGDPLSATNTQQAPFATFTYPTYGKYDVTFSVQSQFGCPSNVATAPIYIGVIPTPSFEMNGISTATPVKVKSTTSISSGVNFPKSDTIQSVWNFNSGVADPATLTYANVYKSTYTTPGHYVVTLKATTTITGFSGDTPKPGCEISYQRPVIIVPSISAATIDASVDGEWVDDFESTDPLAQWQTSSTDPSISSWERGNAAGSPESSTSKFGTNVWATGLSDSYNIGEISYLYSPSFDLRNLARPKVSFNYASFMDANANDGVVLEFSTDTFNIADPLKKWYRLGTDQDGNNWYNEFGLASKPGTQKNIKDGIISGDYGWSAQIDSVLHAQHTISPDIPSWLRAHVIFRFALASMADSKSQGFTLDHFRVGERTRIVLIENFTNTGNANVVNGRVAEKWESDFLTDPDGMFTGVGTDIVKINYHVSFPNIDPFNDDDPADPSARALYYNISETPIARMDGGKSSDPQKKYFSEWGESMFNIRTLKLSDAKLSVTNLTTSSTGGYQFNVVVAAKSRLARDTTILHIAFVEASIPFASLNNSDKGLVTTGQTTFEYVLKKMVPSALGTRFNATLAAGQDQTFGPFEWNPNLGELYNAPNDLAIVVFLQNEITKEIYQAEILTGLIDPLEVTEVEDPDYATNIQLFPNPANHELNIHLPSPVTNSTPVEMFDTHGKTVYQGSFKAGEQMKTISTTELTGGVYLIQLSTPDGGIARRKVMVVHP